MRHQHRIHVLLFWRSGDVFERIVPLELDATLLREGLQGSGLEGTHVRAVVDKVHMREGRVGCGKLGYDLRAKIC